MCKKLFLEFVLSNTDLNDIIFSTQSQKDRQTKRQKDRKTERQKDRKTERQKDRKTERQKDKKTERQKDRKTERQIDRKSKDRKIKIRQTVRQTETQRSTIIYQ